VLALYVSLASPSPASCSPALSTRRRSTRAHRARLGEVYHAVANKYWIDEIVNATVIRLTIASRSRQKWIDENVVDGLVNGVGS
jgi:hypothetical protein